MLAGGRGTRLEPIVHDVPKPLVQVAGFPFLQWVASWLIRQGVSDIVYSAGYLGDQVETWVREFHAAEFDLAACRQEPTPLGTGGAVLACLDLCQGDVMVVNGDTLLLAELDPIVSRFRTERLDGLIAAVPVTDASRFGKLECGPDGLLRTFREKEPGAGLVNGGVSLLTRASLEAFLPVHVASLEADLLPAMLSRGARIGVAISEVPFLDIGVPETLARADEFVATHLALDSGFALGAYGEPSSSGSTGPNPRSIRGPLR